MKNLSWPQRPVTLMVKLIIYIFSGNSRTFLADYLFPYNTLLKKII